MQIHNSKDVPSTMMWCFSVCLNPHYSCISCCGERNR